ncbi:zinc finger protein 593-like [Patiria miniata]|uniref:C2H2-type domain-containing protein n=1 Tax=Patiria miniata TaxID=46514 RepID=A0A913ZC21_PATMI|nr:zinc finger protein 593-like [Patiria miniata]
MTRLARKRHHRGYTHIQKKYRTRRKTKDLDEIHEDMKPESSEKMLNQEIDHDKPGSGQHYCLHCARHFISLHALKEHFRSKLHKRRLKALELEPYTQKEADAAAGLGSYHPPKRKKVTTQKIVEDVEMNSAETTKEDQ